MIRRLATFGQLIGNTDMHFGNLSFYLTLGAPFSLAPIYDMLPMLYAPLAGDQLPRRTLEPPLPTADSLPFWEDMAELAVKFWQTAGSHPLISHEFATQARSNADEIAKLRRSVSGQLKR